MRDTLQVLLQLRSEGMLARFAIGGAVAASYYIEAVATEDLRVHSMIEAGCVDSAVLARLVEKHGLSGSWSIYARRYA